MDNTKKCPKCELVLSRSEFHVVKTKTKKGWRYASDCKTCQVKSATAWRKDNPDKYKQNNKRAMLKHRYGLTIEQFDSMLEDQNSLCAICSDDISNKPYVDHNHKTGKIRKLLCHPCNSALGLFRDSPELLQKAANYLLTNI